MDIREHLGEHILIADGSFGTYYAEKYRTEESPELANILHPERVRAIHSEYIAAGAELIRTNTFASNTLSLGMPIEEVAENISAAADIALECAGECGFAAGDIGEMRGVSSDTAAAEYVRAAEIFIKKGIGIINFESFSDTASLLPAMEMIRSRYGDDVFIMASFCVDRYGSSPSGRSAGRLMAEAAGLADCVGLNCGVGPVHMRGVLKTVSLPRNVFISALPNSGYPVMSRNQLSFGNVAEYFGDKMGELLETGVNIVGGCCGTDPSYIAKTAERLGGARPAKRSVVSDNNGVKKTVRSGFIYGADGNIRRDKLIAVELVPPLDGDDEKLMESAHFLKNAGADVVTFPDSPSGRTRADSVLMAAKVRRETGMEVMPHICCRDKNALAIRSALMGAHINDIGNALMITGDPVPASARQSVKSVFNFDSVGLLRIASELNLDMFAKRPVCCGGAVNQNRRNIDNEILRVKKKMAAGAEFFMSQPVFTPEDADRLRHIKDETGAFILCGIMPLVSRRNALFMKNEISGVNVTDEIIGRYPENGSKEEGETVGIALAKEVMGMVKDFADGYYFTFPFNRVHMLPAVLEG
ncbi:MAG: bifunctional homocysteine S-methyltransferase/methylenetetrahydrofolate reductase [Huintestinicola sp.]|uniref:bifunctional homocysteine S-methyltransferase/methylenetetrahydrofolate reductase n=1 Tax=Huintestinicola sp. TaxID=2981661 RepID=UPI003F000570